MHGDDHPGPGIDPAAGGFVRGIAAALLAVSMAMATYWSLRNRRTQERVDELESEVAELADRKLPELVGRLRSGASPDTALAEIELPAHEHQARILRTAAAEVGGAERMRAATMGACANAAGRVQALTTSMLADLREMQHRHDEKVLGDLLKIDHSIAQAGRLADSIAVLTGSRSGRRWTKPIVMESILRGAVGRIRDYQRVQLHSTSNAAIAGYAAEGVMHALAELMDNATSFSPPSEKVHVYVEDGQVGIAVTIEDGGLVMKPAALERAQRAVSAESPDLSTLSGTRLGLAVVGSLARKYGLKVSFRPSARGGTGVVVLIPRELLTQPRSEPEPAPAPVRSQPVTEPVRIGAAVPQGDGQQSALPQRRRGQTLSAAPRPPASASPKARPDAGPASPRSARPAPAGSSTTARKTTPDERRRSRYRHGPDRRIGGRGGPPPRRPGTAR
ncbi:ATP-binding protein [Saccharopolyspora spinosporotrichia]